MRVLAIDPSTKSGVVCLDGDGTLLTAKHLKFVKERGFYRLQLIAKSIKSIVLDCAPDVVYIEGYAYASKTLVCSVEVGTVIRQELYLAGLEWHEVKPSALKLWTTGSGGKNVKKEQMAESVKARWGFTSTSDDVVDAYALAQYGLAQELEKTGA